MRNRMISCSSLCGFLLITAALTSTLFLPSKTTLAARELADYYPSDDDKEQSKGLVTGSHSTNSGSATGDSSASSTFQDPPPTSRIIDNLNGPPSFSPSNFENDSTTAATTTMPSSGGGGYSGQRPQGYQYESYRSSSSSYQSNSVFRNAETTQASSTRTVTYGSGGVTRVTVVCNSNNEAPRGCEEEGAPNSYP